jgi:hypothetical protein
LRWVAQDLRICSSGTGEATRELNDPIPKGHSSIRTQNHILGNAQLSGTAAHGRVKLTTFFIGTNYYSTRLYAIH